MKRAPVTKKDAAEKFIKGEANSNYPWADADDRVIKAFNLRLTESSHLKLKFIAEHTPHSIHSFIMQVVEKAIDQKIDELINN